MSSAEPPTAPKATSARQAQITLACIVTQPEIAAQIACATSVRHVEELLGAVDLKLDRDPLNAVDVAGTVTEAVV